MALGVSASGRLSAGGDDQCPGNHAGGLRPGEDQGPEDLQQPAPQQAEEEAGRRLLGLPGLQQPVAGGASEKPGPSARAWTEVDRRPDPVPFFNQGTIPLCFNLSLGISGWRTVTSNLLQSLGPGSGLREGPGPRARGPPAAAAGPSPRVAWEPWLCLPLAMALDFWAAGVVAGLPSFHGDPPHRVGTWAWPWESHPATGHHGDQGQSCCL